MRSFYTSKGEKSTRTGEKETRQDMGIETQQNIKIKQETKHGPNTQIQHFRILTKRA